MIGITSPKNRKVGSFLLKMDSCFLEETKFISKLLPKFRRQIWCQEIPRLLLFIISSYYHIIIIKNSDLQISKFQKSKSQVHRTFRKFWDSQILRSQKSIFSKDVPVFFLVFFEVNSWQIEGSRVHYGSKNFRNFGSSRIVKKSIGIDQESSFSHFGIIKTPNWH